MPGTLYIVSTPIGNLEDITLRALRVLREADLICAEDTRVTRKLLSHYDIHTPLTSYHEHSRGEKIESLAERLSAGQSLALVSDAGTPGISDPGQALISAAIGLDAAVVPIPGPCAAIAALTASGLPGGRFAFVGFPPRPKGDRRAFFESLREEPFTLVLYEAPGRVLSTLEELFRTLGDRPLSYGRELTKQFEEIYRGTVSGALERLRARPPRGEFTLIVGPPSPSGQTPPSDLSDVQQALQNALDQGATARDAVQQVSTLLKLPRRLVYRLLLEMQRRAEKNL
jgi:16S rRNA (cytidine1402-2'-O)-methyltransferase